MAATQATNVGKWDYIRLFLPFMRIAIDCRIWSLPGAEELFQAIPLMRTLLNQSSEHSFFLVFDQSAPAEWKTFAHAQCLVLKPAAHTAATRAIWYDLRLPALLSGHQIDLFIGTAGYISLRTPVKQILLLHDALSGVKAPSLTGWPGAWYPRRIPAMLEKAAVRIASGPAQVRGLLPSAAKFNFNFIPFCPAANDPNIAAEPGKLAIKQQFTEGAEFFVCLEGWQTLDDAIELLLAFSAFKKRMQSGMKLVLLGEPPSETDWAEKLRTFRYREDVILIAQPEAPVHKIISAAYALIHLPAGAYFRTLQFALCAGTPVITWPHEAIKEIAGASVCYCTGLPGESLAQNLIRIYKDEKMRSELISMGLELARNWGLENASRRLLRLAIEQNWGR